MKSLHLATKERFNENNPVIQVGIIGKLTPKNATIATKYPVFLIGMSVINSITNGPFSLSENLTYTSKI